MKERVVLAHVYQERELFDGKVHASKRGLMQACAIRELEQAGVIDGVYLAGGYLWGNDGPSFGEAIAEEIKAIGVKLPIYLNNDAVDTPTEQESYAKASKVNGWRTLRFLGNSTHMERIKGSAKRKNFNGEFLETEKILTENPYYSRFLEELKKSEIEKNFKKREKLINRIISLTEVGNFSLAEKVATFWARISRKGKFYVNFDD